jgi:hypothetical protein
MTAPTLGAEDVRRLLAEARAVVDAIDRIAAEAPDADAASFGAHLSDLAHKRWDDVLTVVASADADRFDRRLDALPALAVPLGDAPPSASAPADEAGERMDVLARDLRETFEPLLTPAKQLPPPVLASLGAALRSVAAEFD